MLNSNIFENINTVILDFDGTLVDTKPYLVGISNSVGKKYYNKEITKEEYLSLWGIPFDGVLERLYPDKVENSRKYFIQATLDANIPPITNLVFFLQKLKSKFNLSILSSGTKDYMLEWFKRNGIDKNIFDIILDSKDTKHHKPDGRAFEEILEFYEERGIKLENILYIGDSIDDYKATKEKGIKFIGLDHGKLGTYKDTDAPIAYNFEEVLNLIS